MLAGCCVQALAAAWLGALHNFLAASSSILVCSLACAGCCCGGLHLLSLFQSCAFVGLPPCRPMTTAGLAADNAQS